jgi:hypothetical protein
MPYGLEGPFGGSNVKVQGDLHQKDCISSGAPRDNESIQGDPCGMPSIDPLQGDPSRVSPIDLAQGGSFELPTNLNTSATVDTSCINRLQGSAFALPTNPLVDKPVVTAEDNLT